MAAGGSCCTRHTIFGRPHCYIYMDACELPNEAWTSGFGCPNKRKRRYMDWTLFALLWVVFVEAFADVELLLNF